jgi:2'-5' RNA ligase
MNILTGFGNSYTIDMRYFIGLPIPKTLSDQVAGLQQTWPQTDWPVHFPADIEPHITIKAPFHALDADLLTRIKAVVASSPSLDIQFGQVGFFGHKVIMQRVHSPSLQALQHQLLAVFPETNYTDHELAGYHSHLTLAIANHKLNTSKQLAISRYIHHHLQPAPFVAPAVRIYQAQEMGPYQTITDLGLSASY